MKKIILSCLLLAGLCASVFGAVKRQTLEPIESEIYSFKDGEIEYTNLPQFEIMAIACRIAGVDGFTGNYNGGYAYLDQIDSNAEKYKNHKLIKLIQAANRKGITADGFTNLAYFIEPDFSTTTCDLVTRPVNLNWEWQKISTKDIYAIVSALHDFAKETPFLRFRALYRADYIKVIQGTNEWATKYKTQQWFKEFFGYVMPLTINYSAICAGATFYDFATGSDGNEKYYVTTYPNAYMREICQCYIMCYAQKYADSAWGEVGDTYKNYIAAYQKRINPDDFDQKRIDGYSSYNLALLIAPYCLIEYTGFAFEEESPGIYAELRNSLYKSYQDEYLTKVFEVIDFYKANRDKYPTFKDFYPEVNALIKNLPVE